MFDQEITTLVAQAQPTVVQVHGTQRANGSGIVWRNDGLIITNAHVVAHATTVRVSFNDNTETVGTVVATDAMVDLALVQTERRTSVAAPIGDSTRVRVGELVIAIGHPWGIRNLTTLGIISGIGAINTAWRPGPTEYLRSDVRLAPGNSGGPLLNARGQVIGINAMIFGGDLSVAIPAQIAEQFVLVHGAGPQLGVQLHPVHVKSNAPEAQPALMITHIEPQSLAERAGLLIGDVLLDIADTPIHEPHTLRWALYRHDHQQPLALRIQRGTRTELIMVALDHVS